MYPYMYVVTVNRYSVQYKYIHTYDGHEGDYPGVNAYDVIETMKSKLYSIQFTRMRSAGSTYIHMYMYTARAILTVCSDMYKFICGRSGLPLVREAGVSDSFCFVSPFPVSRQ